MEDLKKEYKEYIKQIKQARIDNNLTADALPITSFKDFPYLYDMTVRLNKAVLGTVNKIVKR